MASASAGPPYGPVRRRRLAGVVALAAITLAAAGCGLFSDDEPTTDSTSTTVPSGPVEEITDADVALCQLAEVLHDVDPDATFETALTGTDDDVGFLLLAVGLFVSGRDHDVRRLAQYEPGIRAIDRRWELASEAADPGVGSPPTVAVEASERSSVEAADRFVAEDRCPE